MAIPLKKQAPPPSQNLSPEDEELFRDFQSNLLSLISHELRTPLTGVLNSLDLLDSESENDSDQFTRQELVGMARKNAQKLHHALGSLLDLAAIGSGTFKVRLREIDLLRIVSNQIRAQEGFCRQHGLNAKFEMMNHSQMVPLLGDPQKMARAMDLFFEYLVPKADPTEPLVIRLNGGLVRFEFTLRQDFDASQWAEHWDQAQSGFDSDQISPGSSFTGVLQSEREFLTRTEEGLGSELMLIYQIIHAHKGELRQSIQDRQVAAEFEIPELSSLESVREVILSRIYESSTVVNSVAFGLLKVPAGIKTGQFRNIVHSCLFRSSDSVYSLPEQQCLAIVLDDCKSEDAPGLIRRICKEVGQDIPFGVVSCPEEGDDPDQLIALAQKRLADSD